MKKQLLLILSLITLVSLFGSASTMKRNNPEDEKPNKKLKLLTQEEFDNLTKEQQKEQIRKEKKIVQNQQTEVEATHDVTNLEELPVIKPKLKDLLIDGIIQLIAKFFNIEDLSRWVKTSKKIHSLIYVYDKNGGASPLEIDNKLAYPAVTLENTISTHNLYFISYFWKSFNKDYDTEELAQNAAQSIFIAAANSYNYIMMGMFFATKFFMALIDSECAATVLEDAVAVHDNILVSMLLNDPFFMSLINNNSCIIENLIKDAKRNDTIFKMLENNERIQELLNEKFKSDDEENNDDNDDDQNDNEENNDGNDIDQGDDQENNNDNDIDENIDEEEDNI